METVETIESRVQFLTKDTNPDEVLELDLDSCGVPKLEGLLDKFKNLQVLSLASTELRTLKDVPTLLNLCELDLSGNELLGGLEFLERCPKLFVLNLSGNKIKDLSAIKPLVKLEKLRELDLSGCPVCQIDNYRQEVFDLFPSLHFLDGSDKEMKETAHSKRYENREIDVDEEGSGDDDDDEDADQSEVGLSYLQKSDLPDDDSEDYVAQDGEDDDSDDDDDDSAEEEIDEEEIKEVQSELEDVEGTRRAMKRKMPEQDEGESQD